MRRRAAQNISKVTGTMETISAVRYRKYYNVCSEGQAFYDALAQLAYLMVTAETPIKHPLMSPPQSNINALIVIGSDRGLCGAYNNELFRQIDTHLKMPGGSDGAEDLGQGRTVLNYLDHLGVEPAGTYEDFRETPTAAQSNAMGDFFMDQYLQGKIGRLGIVYNRFFSPASQKVQTLTVLPIIDLIDDLTTRSTIIWPWEQHFEDFYVTPAADEIFETMAQMIIRTSIAGCFLEATLSEHLARVVSMRNATDNAEEMIRDLTKDYNRARQSQITTELLDIISGVKSTR